jgi:hypothetical protein
MEKFNSGSYTRSSNEKNPQNQDHPGSDPIDADLIVADPIDADPIVADPIDAILSPLNRPTDIPDLNTLFKRLSSQNLKTPEEVSQEIPFKGCLKK